MAKRAQDLLRVLVLAPSGRDATLTAELLESSGIATHVCESVGEVCDAIEEGAAAALIADEALSFEVTEAFASYLARQPPWSDFPVIVFASRASEPGDGLVQLGALGNVSLLDRPVKIRTMLATVRGAIRARGRQYESRQAIRSRDEFLAMLGHELRNPLGVITMAADLMAQSPPEQHPRQRAIIARQAKHLTHMVDDLLDVARVTHGKVTLQIGPVDLAEVLRSVYNSQESAAKASNHRISLTTDANLFVSGDRVRLEQVFVNLLTNAIKYTPAGGTIRVEALRDGAAAVVRVVDSGIGIDPGMIDHVFDVFAQADQGVARSRGGMGLGLTVVRGLVRLHGGAVAARSRGVGEGSEFEVRLPLLERSTPIEPGKDSTESVPHKRIVVVEDSEDLRGLLEEMLGMRGHEVSSACDGPDGLDRILRTRPDLALVDIGLPGFDGLELARRVRAAGVDDVVLVALTGYGQTEDRKRARDAGFDEHVTKPVDARRVDLALRTRRAAHP